MVVLVMALLSFADSAPRLKVGNASIPTSTTAGTFPWWEHHQDKWVAASRLNDEVQQLLLRGRKFSRQRINYEVRQLLGTRIADYLLEEKRPEGSKWATAEFRLTWTAPARADDQQDTVAESKRDAPAAAAAASGEAAAEFEGDDADGWKFNREPDDAAVRPEPAAPATPPDASNAEGRLAVWRNAFAPLSSETEPCLGWRPRANGLASMRASSSS